MITRFALEAEEVEHELESLAAPKVTITPKTESDKARAWLNGLDLDNMQNNDMFKSEFFKHEVAVLRGEKVFYFSTRSPQQRTWRRSLATTWARGEKSAILDGLERFLKQMEAKRSRRIAQRDAKRQARAAFVNPYKVGDFLYSSWGYDQTNREFYQVLEVRDVSLKIWEVAQNREGYDSGNCSPIRDNFVKAETWVTIQVSEDGNHRVPSPIHGGLYKWDGRELYWSSYH